MREFVVGFHFQPDWETAILERETIDYLGTEQVRTSKERVTRSLSFVAMIQTLKQMLPLPLSLSSGEDIVECRDCGATVEPEIDSCPVCGSDEIAYYEIQP